MLSGCQVNDGIGRMLVTAVGINSEWGRTLARLSEGDNETPLQKKLDDMAKSMSWQKSY
jgi:Ca2+-transporting ATPase